MHANFVTAHSAARAAKRSAHRTSHTQSGTHTITGGQRRAVVRHLRLLRQTRVRSHLLYEELVCVCVCTLSGIILALAHSTEALFPHFPTAAAAFFVLCCYSKSVSFSEKRSLSLFHLFSSTPRRERTKHAHSTTTATLTPMKNQSQCCVGACWFVRNEILMNITHTHTKKTDVHFKR